MLITPTLLRGRAKPPRGMATVDRSHPIGGRVTACWAFNEGGGGALTELVSGVQCPITLNATEANRPRWTGGADGLSSLDFLESPVTASYARGQKLKRVVYSKGITFFGVFRYPTGGSAGENRCLVMTRADGLNGLMWSFSTTTLTISTKGWGGWNVNTGLTPPRDQLIAFVGSHDKDSSIRLWMNGQRYSTSGATWSTPTGLNEWYIGVDSYDTSRQWHGKVYLTGVLDGALSWGQMETWARSPFEFLWPRGYGRTTSSILPEGGGAVPVFMNHYRQQGICG